MINLISFLGLALVGIAVITMAIPADGAEESLTNHLYRPNKVISIIKDSDDLSNMWIDMGDIY